MQPSILVSTVWSTRVDRLHSTTDLHLELSGHRAGNRGLDLSSSFTEDIDGTTRTDTWDIGADEGVTGTNPLTPKILRWAEVAP